MTEHTNNKTTEKTAEKNAEKPAEKPAEKHADKHTDKPAEKISDKITDKIKDKYESFINDIASTKKVEEEVKKKTIEEENQDLRNTLQRLAAEFDNYKKRTDKEKADYKTYLVKDFVEKLLPIIDSFELALKDTKSPEQFKKGVEMIYSQLYTMLEKEGLKPIDALGEKLDPYKHEALLHEKSSKPDDTIIEELSKGYMLKDAVVRTSKVKIAKN